MKKSKMSIPTQNKLATSRKVLGIDPGFDRVGIAILEKDVVLFSKCIETNRKDPHEKRLLEIGESIRGAIKKWKPDCLAIEQLFFNQNTTNALKVSEARGVIIYEASCAKLDVYEYSPQAIKIAVTGYGKADKTQVKNMLQKLVKIPFSKARKLDDELDAIAVGITHLASKKKI